jgi:glycosyltransferase involved in cell wall biosynthesis
MERGKTHSEANKWGDMSYSCTCMIPFYNEGSRILSVLKVIAEVAELSQIICVDDGSDDRTWIRVTSEYPQVNLLRLENNCGKTEAVRAGLELVKNNYILLLDADLEALDCGEIRAAVQAISIWSHLDMIILRRVNAGIYSKLNRGDILYAGERLLRSDDLKAALAQQARGYQLEVLINKYMKDNRKTVYWMPSSARNTYKVHKIGFLAGTKAEIDMISQILSYHGPKEYFEQYGRFALQKLPEKLGRGIMDDFSQREAASS